MTKKQLRLKIEYSSIFYDAKWAEGISIEGFSSRKPRCNRALIDSIKVLINWYNKYGDC